ncbi:MAG TPA: glycosyltransferase family 2 protein [Candidatus Methanoperedens sp.]|nr:glycosyltransferase family 2 protein [Candidatus Methanoperedens sp.]
MPLKKNINISVVIPNFNGAKYLSECLVHLHTAIHSCQQSKFEIILVDNGSSDNSLELFNYSSTPLVNHRTIKLKTNTGFATAVNKGILAAKHEYVCLLNNDVNLDKNFFKLIISSIKKHPTVACFCGTVLSKDGSKIESQGISFDWSGKCIQNHFSTSQPLNYSSKHVWGSSGAAVIYNKDILLKIGLYDEHYFAYIEDVDVAFRLNKNNYKTLLIPSAKAFHLGGATSNKMGNFRAKQTFKNWIYFIKKNYSTTELLKNLPQIIVERLRNFSYLIKSTINK